MAEPGYYRPDTMAEALELLKKGVPLAGGTTLIKERWNVANLVDLQNLALDGLDTTGAEIKIGSMVRLQALFEAAEYIAPALRDACVHETGWNLRNMRTVGGSIMGTDGRSPFMTAFLALRPVAVLAPGDEQVTVDDLLDKRSKGMTGRLITEITISRPQTLVYKQVARSPLDRPIVACALAKFADGSYSVVLSGYGDRPIRISAAETALAAGDVAAAAEAAALAYADAADEWASAAYRAETAAVLVSRLAKEVVG